jgi:SAM-dependent methyltransferase
MMRPLEDALDLLNGSLTSAALGAALEMGLFWMLDEQPQSLAHIADAFGIPHRRCGYWLQLLAQAGLVEGGGDLFRPSPAAREGILNRFSRDTWAFLALEARERYPAGVNLTKTIRAPSVPGSEAQPEGHYLTLMATDPERARRFTRMLYELHRALADEIPRRLDLTGATRLLDVGGGSGVVSLALVRQHPGLTAVVVDIANVCEAGRAIATENRLENRVTFYPADVSCDTLPAGFDFAIMCDVGTFDQAVFRRIGDALNAAGRFALVDDFAPERGVAPHARATWALARSLADPAYDVPTVDQVVQLLPASGFRVLRVELLDVPGERDPLTIVEAAKL